MIEIGELQFPSKKAAKEHFRIILRHDLGTPIPDPAAAELTWLLWKHPERKQKIGRGIKHFEVRKIPPYGTTSFFVVRIDETETDFSYVKCIDGPPSSIHEAKHAMRAEIFHDIQKAKHDYFAKHGDAGGRIQCATTGAQITIGEAHVDHAPPWYFEVLATSFIEAKGINVADGFLTPSADTQYVPRMADRDLAEAWRQYHHKLAELRIVSKWENCARAADAKGRRGDRQLILTGRGGA